jgi:hypothetical protein
MKNKVFNCNIFLVCVLKTLLFMTSRVKFNEAHFPALGKKPTHSKKDDRKPPINQNQTPRDETPENNDTRFLQWTVLAYKKNIA